MIRAFRTDPAFDVILRNLGDASDSNPLIPLIRRAVDEFVKCLHPTDLAHFLHVDAFPHDWSDARYVIVRLHFCCGRKAQTRAFMIQNNALAGPVDASLVHVPSMDGFGSAV